MNATSRFRLAIFLMSLALFLGVFATPVSAFSGSGKGTADDPFIITTPAQLNEVRNNGTACYRLGNDIDMSSYGSFTPIGWEGASAYPFYGTFDGDYHTIKGLTINQPNRDYVGLFGGLGSADKGKVMNLRLTGVNVTGMNFVGGLVGQARYGAVVERVYVDGAVKAPAVNGVEFSGYCVGGLIGNMGFYGVATVSECVSKATVTSGFTIAGGLVGTVCEDSTPFLVSDSYATGRVTAPPATEDPWDPGGAVGGLAGWIEGTVRRSYSTGEVTGGKAGGLVGGRRFTPIEESSYWNTATSKMSTSAVGTGKTTAQMKQRATYEGWDFDRVWAINEGNSYPYLRWETRPVMRGSIAIEGSTRYGETLTVNDEGLTYTGAAPGNALGYQWKRNGAAIAGADGPTYTLTESDLGKAITVIVSADGLNAQGRVVSPATASVAKADALAPEPPSLSGATYSNLTLAADSLCEFGMGGADSHEPTIWQKSNVFTGLQPGTDYRFYARLKETATHKASPASVAAVHKTALSGIGGSVDLEGVPRYGEDLAFTTTLTYEPSPATPDSPSYQWKRDGVAIPGANGLTYRTVGADVGKEISLVVIADGVNATGTVSSPGLLIGKAAGPAAPVLDESGASSTFSTVTLPADAAYEYSMDDGETWQGGPDGHVFANLAPETMYTFLARVAETSTHEASSPSSALSVTTRVKPKMVSATITITGDPEYLQTLEVSHSDVVYEPATSDDTPLYQWMLDGIEIPGANGPLYPISEYDIGQRISVRLMANDVDAEGYVDSAATGPVAKALSHLEEGYPPVEDESLRTLTSVTIADESHNDPHEYRVNEGPWQRSFVFNNLVPGTTNKFEGRARETQVRKASGVSSPLFVTLDPDNEDPCWPADSAITVLGSGTTHITLSWTQATDNAAIGSYRVYQDGVLVATTATAGYTVTGLRPSTSYSFRVEAYDVVGRLAPGGPESTAATAAPERDPGPSRRTGSDNPDRFDGVIKVDDWTGLSDAEITCAPGSSSYTLEMEGSSLSGANGDARLVVSTGLGTIAVPSNMLSGTEHEGSGQVRLTIGLSEKDSLPEGLRAAIGDRPLIRLSLDVDGEGAPWSNPDAPVTVSIPYTPTPEELLNPEAITVWYIDGAGKIVEVPSGRYDPAMGIVTFSTTHFSDYAVVFVEKTFADLDGVPWARREIEVLASKGIVKGAAEASFNPDAQVTRADFLLMLVRTLGLSTREIGSFVDVPEPAYYHDAVGIAKTLGVTNGVDGVRFVPGSPITRQDMMVLAKRALSIAGKLPPASSDPASVSTARREFQESYADSPEVAPYALDGIISLVSNGLIAGDGGRIDPLRYTTRAQAAVFLYRVYNRR